MSIELRYVGRLGNQLFQYAFGRILAEALGYELTCVPAIDPFASAIFADPADRGAATLPELTAHFRNAPQRLPGKRFEGPEERHVFEEPGPDGRAWDGHRIDLPALIADRRDRKLVLRGFFQRFDYYRAHRARLLEWFALEPLDDPFGITKRDLVVNIRRGFDYALAGWVLSLTAYQKLIAELPHDRLFLCGVGIDDEVERAFARFSPIHFRSSPIDEFRFLQKFDRIVQSNSTFCWWAGLLSSATALYTPRPDRGYLSREMGGDALATGEERYRLFDARVLRLIAFRPQPRARLSFDAGSGSLFVESAAGVATIACAPGSSRFYEWLAEQREPFGPRELAPFGIVNRSQVERVIGPLVESGALLFDQRLVEE